MAFFTSQTRTLRRETSQRRQLEVFLPVFSLPHAVTDVCRRQILSRLIPAAPSPPPPPPSGYCGAFARLVSPGGGAFGNPGANPELLTRTRFPIRINYTEDFTGKTSRLAHFSRTGIEKLKRFVKACSLFYPCISSLLIKPEVHSEIGSYRRESTFSWLLNQISVDIYIWRTSFHIYKTVHNS